MTGHDDAATAHMAERLTQGPMEHRARAPHGPLPWIGAAVAFAVVALLGVAVLRPAQDNPLVVLNRPAADFKMSLYSGGALRLSDLRGKTVVLNFWWSNCVPCVQEAPVLERAWQAWKHRNVVFIGIDEQDDPASAAPRRFLRRYGVTYPNGWDPGDVDIQYGTTGQPETFFITPSGRIKSKYAMPFVDVNALARLIGEARA